MFSVLERASPQPSSDTNGRFFPLRNVALYLVRAREERPYYRAVLCEKREKANCGEIVRRADRDGFLLFSSAGRITPYARVGRAASSAATGYRGYRAG